MNSSRTRGVLAVMGSGETSPTMVSWHRRLMEAASGPAVLVDTSYGFQENAAEISARAEEYFSRNVGLPIEVVPLGPGLSEAERETAYERLRGAGYVFAGPGSPTYALRQWQGSPVPEILSSLLADGATLCFASAAALTLGRWTVPVYEIYKAGQDPEWRPGLDVLGTAGIADTAVIPHFDNREGGHHDTRFCYLGEPRLRAMERQVDDAVSVLGVDEHTIAVVDFEEGTLIAGGRGQVSLRRRGLTVAVVPADGPAVELGTFFATPAAADAGREPPRPGPASAAAPDPRSEASPLLEQADRLDGECRAALAAGDFAAATAAILALDTEIAGWSADTLQSDEVDRARAKMRSMIVSAGEAAAKRNAHAGAQEERAAALVDGLLDLRSEARAAGDFAASDRLRDLLARAGVEVRDTPGGQEWSASGERATG